VYNNEDDEDVTPAAVLEIDFDTAITVALGLVRYGKLADLQIAVDQYDRMLQGGYSEDEARQVLRDVLKDVPLVINDEILPIIVKYLLKVRDDLYPVVLAYRTCPSLPLLYPRKLIFLAALLNAGRVLMLEGAAIAVASRTSKEQLLAVLGGTINELGVI